MDVGRSSFCFDDRQDARRRKQTCWEIPKEKLFYERLSGNLVDLGRAGKWVVRRKGDGVVTKFLERVSSGLWLDSRKLYFFCLFKTFFTLKPVQATTPRNFIIFDQEPPHHNTLRLPRPIISAIFLKKSPLMNTRSEVSHATCEIN